MPAATSDSCPGIGTNTPEWLPERTSGGCTWQDMAWIHGRLRTEHFRFVLHVYWCHFGAGTGLASFVRALEGYIYLLAVQRNKDSFW